MDYIELGYLGLFIATFLAATVVPFSSELIVLAMLGADYDVLGVVGIATAGNTVGGMSSYFLGYLGKWEWIEQKFGIRKVRVDALKKWVNQYGSYTAFFCWVPFVGDVLAIALGFFRANIIVVLMLMTLGKALRYGAIAYGFESI